MTPQERQLIDDLFDRLAKLENAPRDGEAMSAIMQGLRKAPNAVYALVQTTLVQDEALKRADSRIQELEAAIGQQNQPQNQPARIPQFDARRDFRAEPATRPRPVARFSAQRSRARDRRQPSGVEHGPGFAAGPTARTIQSARPTPSPMARSRRSSSRRSAAVAARFSAPRRRPPSAWSVARCWPAASAR